ncbi:DUF2268 domain-containing protein [Patescibacteria group bacterium]|nr:DUF2268 domain-containing protein [Patescibacteria group bacterium]
MKIKIIYIPSNNKIQKSSFDLVDKVIKKHSKKAAGLLPFKINNFTFTVYSWEKDGVSAFTQANNWVDIKINFDQLVKKNKVDAKLLDQLIYIIYHEMHHACRGYAGILPKNKEHILINSIISEGLADHFAIEQYPVKSIIETKKFDLKEIQPWIKKLKKVMWNKESEDDSWLYGGDKKPKMIGYKIGRYMIQEIKNNFSDQNSVKLVYATPEKIIGLSKVSF